MPLEHSWLIQAAIVMVSRTRWRSSHHLSGMRSWTRISFWKSYIFNFNIQYWSIAIRQNISLDSYVATHNDIPLNIYIIYLYIHMLHNLCFIYFQFSSPTSTSTKSDQGHFFMHVGARAKVSWFSFFLFFQRKKLPQIGWCYCCWKESCTSW